MAVVPAVLFSGCDNGNASGAGNTLVRIQPSNYVTLAPATTTIPTTTLPDPNLPPPVEYADGEQSYQIRANDSMFKIGALFEVDAELIAIHNGWNDGINHLLIPGDVILIPPGARVPGDEPDEVETGLAGGEQPSLESQGCTYVIQLGDNPSKVADRFGVSLLDLQGINSESVMSSFLVGATIIIPPGGDCDQ